MSSDTHMGSCKQFTDSDESFFHKQFCKAKLACDQTMDILRQKFTRDGFE